MGIRLSEKHGVNPALEQCFVCGEARGVVLFGRLPNDKEAPRQVVMDRSPCEKCLGLMQKGVILISVASKVRNHTCRRCKHAWSSPVTLSEHTPNISGEAKPVCPQCSSTGVNSTPVEEPDGTNPYRTGGWVVVCDEFLKRNLQQPDFLDHILKKRIAFVPDDTWDMLGLPRGPVEGIPSELS
jgi:hypothetical protein